MTLIRFTAAAVLALSASAPAFSQTYDHRYDRRAVQEYRNPGDPHAPGYRCNGMSYGTGAQSCGTATGGPVGGIGARN